MRNTSSMSSLHPRAHSNSRDIVLSEKLKYSRDSREGTGFGCIELMEVLPLVNPIHPKASSSSRDTDVSERGIGPGMYWIHGSITSRESYTPEGPIRTPEIQKSQKIFEYHRTPHIHRNILYRYP